MSGLINKIKDTFSSNSSNDAAARTAHYDKPLPSDHTGQHGSSTVNKADPRVDTHHEHGSNPASTLRQDESYGTSDRRDESHGTSDRQNESHGTSDRQYDSSTAEPGHHGIPTTGRGDTLVGSDLTHPRHRHALKERHDQDYADTQTGLGDTGQELGHDESTDETTPGAAGRLAGTSAGYDGSLPRTGGHQYNDQPIAGRDGGELGGSMLNRPGPQFSSEGGHGQIAGTSRLEGTSAGYEGSSTASGGQYNDQPIAGRDAGTDGSMLNRPDPRY